MKNYSFYFLGLLFLLLIPARSFSQDKAPLPPFSVKDGLDQTITPANFEKNMPVIVLYFDPDCDHCQQQAEWIAEDFQAFKDIQLLFVSWGEMPAIKEFAEKYFGDVDQTRVWFTKDTEYQMDNWFGYSEVPSVYVYNKNHLRIASFKKETPAAELKAALN